MRSPRAILLLTSAAFLGLSSLAVGFMAGASVVGQLHVRVMAEERARWEAEEIDVQLAKACASRVCAGAL